jgi:RecB family exonuclease
MARVSFSQYSMWSACPYQYKLAYVDGLRESSSNIHTVFGSAMHETLQEYLSRCLRISKSQADKNMNTKEFLKEKMRESFLKESNEGQNPICSKEELVEFLEDGYLILDYFQKSKNFNNFFSLKDDELIAIEQVINTKISENVNFMGFIDFIVRSKSTGRYRITDFKTSTRGWTKSQKADSIKSTQLLLYKKFYAELLNISEDIIDVEFIILKRKVSETTEYNIPRISRHVPASGKPSMTKSWKGFTEFVNSVFDANGEYNVDSNYPKYPSKLCDWCEFKQRGICDGKI